jgi:hypothetical protein
LLSSPAQRAAETRQARKSSTNDAKKAAPVPQKKKAAGKSSTLTPVPSSDAVGPEEDEEVKAGEDQLEGSSDDSVNVGLPSPATSSANGVVGKQTLESGSQTPSRRVSRLAFRYLLH